MSPDDTSHNPVPSGAAPDAGQPEAPLSYRTYREDDAEGLLQLLSTTFARWPVGEPAAGLLDHLRWKLRSHEDASRYHMVAQTADGQIVGSRLFFIQHVKVGQHVFYAHQEVDACVRPDYQGKGVMREMGNWGRDLLTSGSDLAFTLQSRDPAMRQLNLRDDPESFFARLLIVQCSLRQRFLARSLPDLRLITLRALSNARHLIRRGRADWMVRQVEVFDERIDAFFREASAPFDAIVVRSKEYLNWRYADPRAGIFAIRLAEQDGRILGFSVLSVIGRCGYIADLLTLPERLDVAGALIEDAIDYFRRTEVSEVECWTLPHHPYRPLLRRHGFLRRRSVRIKFLPQRASREQLAALGKRHAVIHLAAGDTDMV